ncbi:hypothetical protein, partial [Streptomyces lydicus]|uniref:hypothetical protein n=1 Tax=Streptomyces lydicus TaxID=47763 RepID=UPI00378AD539
MASTAPLSPGLVSRRMAVAPRGQHDGDRLTADSIQRHRQTVRESVVSADHHVLRALPEWHTQME